MLRSRCPEAIVGSSGASSLTPCSVDSTATSVTVSSRSSSTTLNSKFSIESLVGAPEHLLKKGQEEAKPFQQQRNIKPAPVADYSCARKAATTLSVDCTPSGFSTATARTSSGSNQSPNPNLTTAFVRVPSCSNALATPPPTGYFPSSPWQLTSAAAAVAASATMNGDSASYIPLQKNLSSAQLPSHLYRGLAKHHPYLPDAGRLWFWSPHWLDIFKDVYALPQQYGADFSGLTNLLLPPFRKPKRNRTAFSPFQLVELERAFELNHYVIGGERKDLACRLQLSETQVKVWFQNRRTKHKRVKIDKNSTPTQNTESSDYPTGDADGGSRATTEDTEKDEAKNEVKGVRE